MMAVIDLRTCRLIRTECCLPDKTEIELFQLTDDGQTVSTDRLLVIMDSWGLRPLTEDELDSLVDNSFSLDGLFPIVALGSARERGVRKLAAALTDKTGHQELMDTNIPWKKTLTFAVVSKTRRRRR